MKFYGYVGERGTEVHLHPLRGPLTTKPSVASVFDHVLGHERHVTERMRRLIDQGRGARSDDEGSDGHFGKFNPPVELNPEGVSSGAFQRGTASTPSLVIQKEGENAHDLLFPKTSARGSSEKLSGSRRMIRITHPARTS